LIVVVTTAAATDDGHAAALNGLVQGAGYAAACIAPTVIGAVHESSGGWTQPLVAIAASVTVFGVLAVLGARRAAVEARP
jgi:CP family cyanate transporter-like MFS transporter